MRTEIALGSRVSVVIDIDSVIRARLHTHFAADAVLVIEINDSIVADEQRRGGARLDARSIGAVIAPHNTHFTRCGGVLPLVHVLHPGSKLAYRYIMLDLTRHRACVTTDTCALIYCKAVTQCVTSF